MHLYKIALCLPLASLSAVAAAADGAAIYRSRCAACHGPTAGGQPALQAPPLAGQQAAYLVKQLQGFRAGWRGVGDGPGAVMRSVAQTLPDDATVQAIANYLAALRLPAPIGTKPADNATLMAGKGLFGVCIGCHGTQGEGNPALGAPRLNHLPPTYLEMQLQAYRNGRRGAEAGDTAGQQMRQVAIDALPGDAATQQVVAYIATLLRPRSGR